MKQRVKETHMLAIKAALETTYDTHREIADRFEVSQSWVGKFAQTYDIRRPDDYAEVRSELTAMKVSEARFQGSKSDKIKRPDEAKIAKIFKGCRFEDMAFKPAPYIPRVFA